MNGSNIKQATVNTAASAQVMINTHQPYIGLDTHKDNVTVAIAEPGRGAVHLEGEIANKAKSINKLIKRVSERFEGQLLLFCYEAGPCGFELYRQILAAGHDCQVIAPSQVSKKAGEKIKTDKRDAVKAATNRVETMTEQMMQALPGWSMAPVVHSLIALRGIDKHSAMVLLAELGDISRFDSPSQLMAFLGLVPGEHSSDSKRCQGSITRTGNGHARRILVESGCCYRSLSEAGKNTKVLYPGSIDGQSTSARDLSSHALLLVK